MCFPSIKNTVHLKLLDLAQAWSSELILGESQLIAMILLSAHPNKNWSPP